MNTIYDALRQDHKTVKTLLSELVSLKEDSPRRGELVQKIAAELIPHARAEEAVFYNSLRSVPVFNEDAWHGYKEHMQAETLLRALQVAEKFDAGFLTIAKKLQEALEHHISEEEGELFPLAEGVINEQEATQMERAFTSMKSKVKEESFVGTTIDMVANMMPTRFLDSFREGHTKLYDDKSEEKIA